MKLVNNKMNKLRSHLQDVRADAVQKGNKVAAKPPRAAGRKKSKQVSGRDLPFRNLNGTMAMWL
jgi:hypothetical protein